MTSELPNNTSFSDLYDLGDVLGSGSFSTVRTGIAKSPSSSNSAKIFAVKCITRAHMLEEDKKAFLDEVSILKEMKHRHIISLFDFFEEEDHYYLVMEQMKGGELFDRIVFKSYYSEKEARDVIKIVLEAVAFMHGNNVVHRDLKPENLLLVSKSDDALVKVADFGFAGRVSGPDEDSLKTRCGTPCYIAPEIIMSKRYGTKVDMWSIGVILFILLSGYPPFGEDNQRLLFRKIRKGEFEFDEDYWSNVSQDAKDLVSSLLTVDSKKRLNAKQALLNKWVCGDDTYLSKRDLSVQFEKLKHFNAVRKLRAAVLSVTAVQRLHGMAETPAPMRRLQTFDEVKEEDFEV